ncbi:MAG: hypothetical protein CM15mP102_01920 [Flavobacteriales bacterium]|nr:MAG: hypothetical protein CM15mP102_01920 [Flavobacteriales bacterium]
MGQSIWYISRRADDVPCVFWNIKTSKNLEPILINFQHLWFLTQDAWYTSSIKDKLKIWFMPTGWRPKDVVKKSRSKLKMYFKQENISLNIL